LKPFTTDQKKIDGFVATFKEEGFKETVGKFVDGMFKPGALQETKDFVKSNMQSATPHVAQSAMKNMLDPKIWTEDKINVPLLCLMAKSGFWKDEYEKFVRKLALYTTYQTMEGVGHFLMMDDSPAFNYHLLEFLKKYGFVK